MTETMEKDAGNDAKECAKIAVKAWVNFVAIDLIWNFPQQEQINM